MHVSSGSCKAPLPGAARPPGACSELMPVWPGAIGLSETWLLQTSTKLYLVLDFVNGGHLFFQLYRQVSTFHMLGDAAVPLSMSGRFLACSCCSYTAT